MVKEYVVEKHLDYLTFTSKAPVQSFATKPYQLIKSPLSNYDMCEQHMCGMLHMWHTRDSRVGHHFILSATCLAWFRQHGHNERKLLEEIIKTNKVSRIDIAITSKTVDETVHEFTPHNLAIATIAGMLKSRMKPSKDITENLITQTKYIGNRKKRTRLFRAYDKGADNNELSNILVRYELETRKGTETVARAVADGTDYGSIMRRYIDFPTVEVWTKIMNAEPAHMTHAAHAQNAQEQDIERRGDRWEWLRTSIAPVVAKALNEDFEKDGLTVDNNVSYHDFIAEIIAHVKYRNLL